MPKRGRKKKFKLNLNIRAETVRSAIGVLLILLSGIILVSFLASGYSANSKIQEMLRLLFGYAHLFLIPILCIFGLLLFNKIKWRFVEIRIVSGFILLLFSVSGLLHVFYGYDSSAYNDAKNGNGGGILGFKILSILANTISVYGAVLVLLALTIVGAIVVLDKPIDEVALNILEQIKKLKILNKIGFKIPNIKKIKDKKDSEDEYEIEITSGLNISNTDTGSPYNVETKAKNSNTYVEEPSFEIIPTMSEPQSAKSQDSAKNTTDSLVPANPHLPYTDKVWELPPLELLSEPPNIPVDRGDVKQRAKIIEETLKSFGIASQVKETRFGPSVTQYALEAEAGTKIAKISGLQYDLALALASPSGSVRIEAPIPGRSLVGIEVPNNNRVAVNFKTLLTSDQMKANKSKLGIVLGLDVGGQPVVYDIQKMPHLLIAGATGSGKSVFIHNLMFSILYKASPQECKFIMIDPKRVELVYYNDIPHLLTPVVTDIEKAPAVFKWAVSEMERRYKLLEAAKVRHIDAYNEKSGFQALPYIVIIVDELGEIMVTDPASVEKSIIRIAQLARATGIHLVLALQRPSTNVITGLIKANIPCRIAFNVTSQVDSRVIIDQPGAEKLLGKGDMLFVPPDDSKPRRLQGAFISDKEINNLVSYLKAAGLTPDYREEEIFSVPDNTKSISAGGDNVDDLFHDAVEIVTAEKKASASLLQRRLSIGYARAARILDELEAKRIIGPANGSKPRDVLVGSSDTLNSLYE